MKEGARVWQAVDFTLEDMHKQTEEIVEQALSKERRHTDGRFDELLLVTA